MSVTMRPKTIVADAADDGGADLHLGQIDRGVGRAAADGQQHAVGHDQLAGRRHMADRRADVVGDDDAGAKDVDGGHSGILQRWAKAATVFRRIEVVQHGSSAHGNFQRFR